MLCLELEYVYVGILKRTSYIRVKNSVIKASTLNCDLDSTQLD